MKNNNVKILDIRTDYGKGISYKACNGREYATSEALAEANKIYLSSMMINPPYRDEDLERANKAYFDYLNSKFNINDNKMTKKVFREQQEKIMSYIEERYGNYLAELLEQYGYSWQDNRGLKR